jgi:drug/metabolite transporter (DMT)-like permease
MLIIAIFLGILSYSMLNIGMGLQKKGAFSLPKIEKQSILGNLKGFFTNKFWVIGFTLVQIQWVFLTLALDLASVSIITPLMSVGMVALVIFAYFYLKEPITKIEIIGISIIIIGIMLFGVTSREQEEIEDFNYVLQHLSKGASIIFLGIVFSFSIILIVVSILRKFKNADILFSIAAGITDALGAIFIRAVMGGADFGGDGTKIQESAHFWEWWLIMGLMILLNGTATVYLQVAYQRGKAVIVAPIFSVLAMITPVLGGIIIFDEWSTYFIDQLYWLLFGKLSALILILIGATILSISSASIRELKVSDKVSNEVSEIDESINGFSNDHV